MGTQPFVQEESSSSPALEQRRFTRRKKQRYKVAKSVDWDFFTSATGAKGGFIENLSEGGCLLRTNEPIEHRRWIRLVVKEQSRNLWFTSVGRVIRVEDKIEAWDDRNVTLHRYGVEFIHPVNPVVLQQLQEVNPTCAACGEPTGTIPDLHKPNTLYCVLCHLRKACHGLLVHDGLEPA